MGALWAILMQARPSQCSKCHSLSFQLSLNSRCSECELCMSLCTPSLWWNALWPGWMWVSTIHVKHCLTMILFSAHCTTGNTANVKEEQDKSKFNSLYHLHHACCSENVYKKHNMGVAYSWTLHKSISLQKYLAKMTTSAWLLQFQGSLNSLVVWLRNSKTQLSSINPLTIPISFKGLISTDTCQQANLYQFIGNHPVQDWIIASR